MENKIYNTSKIRMILMVIVQAILPMGLVAQQLTESRILTRCYAVTPETDVEVVNKYGMVHVETWNKDSVQFEIEAIANAKKKEDLTDILNNIDFQFISTDHYVLAKTVFINPTKFLIKDLKNLFGKTNDVNINYKIKVPQKLNLSLENKYGDMFVSSLDGNIKLKLSYGKLKADACSGTLNLELEFGDANLKKVEKCQTKLNFSNMTITSANNINITSNFSDISIDKVEMATINSKHDDISFVEVKDLMGNTNFSNITINYLEKSMNMELKFGDVKIMKFSPAFSKVDLGSRYTDITMYVNTETTGFDVDIIHQNSKLVYPRNCTLKEELINEKNKQYRTSGHAGPNNGNATIYINSFFGEINLKKQ